MAIMRPYQFCSKEEFIERQELSQVSEMEATLESCHLPQSKRILDPCLAISKYRRSAAGGDGDRSVRGREELIATLARLTQICATHRATPRHPKIKNMDTVVSFVTDRLRACQSDATRGMSNTQSSVPASWHARVIRILIWLQYTSFACSTRTEESMSASATARTISHMRSTAYDAYWNSREQEQEGALEGEQSLVAIKSTSCDDDEMLCYDAMSRICAASKISTTNGATSLETSWNGILIEFSKRRQEGMSYPLWTVALEVTSHVRREEYYVLWGDKGSVPQKLPILAKSILVRELLLPARHRTVQHYNLSFGKGEMVADMDRLLGIETNSRHSPDATQPTKESATNSSGWCIEYANIFGLPVEEECKNEKSSGNLTTSKTIKMKLKHVAMPAFDSRKVDAKAFEAIRNSDRRWIFGKFYDGTNDGAMGLSSELVMKLLEFGSPSVSNGSTQTGFDSACCVLPGDKRDKTLDSINVPASSLARAMAASRVGNSNGISSSRDVDSIDVESRPRASPLTVAPDRIKTGETKKPKKRKSCLFFRTSKGCRFGDKCHFEHS